VARPRTPLLSRRGIAEAALELIDADGLDALSMRRLAARLDVEAASLYHHVVSREDLLDEVIALINEDVELAPLGGHAKWQDRLAAFARSYHQAFARHPEIVAVAMRRPIQTAAALKIYDRLLAFLLDAGWDATHATTIVAALDHLVLGSALETFAAGFDRPAEEYAADHPVVARVLDQSDRATLAVRSFELGLRAFLAGVGEPDGESGGTVP
jgi:AcrR family transcriptional regulator